jgi:hypothetical protein
MENWEQTSEKKFNRTVNATNAVCTTELGSQRFSVYYANNGEGEPVARIDSMMNEGFQINTTYQPNKS